MDLPDGVLLHPLKSHADERGSLTEIFCESWAIDIRLCQWNVTFSNANVLRGLHVHQKHRDYLVLLRGQLSVGFYDTRPHSPTFRRSAIVPLRSDDLSGVVIPVGVLHGFYCHEPSWYIVGMDRITIPTNNRAAIGRTRRRNLNGPAMIQS